MNKSEFIDHISKEHNCSKTEAEKIINIFTKSVISASGSGNEISLVGFGSFLQARLLQDKDVTQKLVSL